jgi:hypothetical protein
VEAKNNIIEKINRCTAMTSSNNNNNNNNNNKNNNI